MPIPKHLEPKTFWEARCALLEIAVGELANIIGNYIASQQAIQQLNNWDSTWHDNLKQIADQYSPQPTTEGEPKP